MVGGIVEILVMCETLPIFYWEQLGKMCEHLVTFGKDLAIFGNIWERFGNIWERFGNIWERFGKVW